MLKNSAERSTASGQGATTSQSEAERIRDDAGLFETTDTRRLPSPDRHLAVSPLDMRQTKFSMSMRGFDRSEVTAFLLEAADGYEQALRENERLRMEIARLEASL